MSEKLEHCFIEFNKAMSFDNPLFALKCFKAEKLEIIEAVIREKSLQTTFVLIEPDFLLLFGAIDLKLYLEQSLNKTLEEYKLPVSVNNYFFPCHPSFQQEFEAFLSKQIFLEQTSSEDFNKIKLASNCAKQMNKFSSEMSKLVDLLTKKLNELNELSNSSELTV